MALGRLCTVNVPGFAQSAVFGSGCVLSRAWNKTPIYWFNLMRMSGLDRNSGSFEELAMPLFDQLYNFAHWLTHNREEAEDLVQETYAKALKGFSSFQLGTNFRAWMYRILRNTFLTSRTGLKASATIALDADDSPELPAGPDTPETIFIEHSQHQFLQAAIKALPLHFREA